MSWERPHTVPTQGGNTMEPMAHTVHGEEHPNPCVKDETVK
jgi:hypothetical protein